LVLNHQDTQALRFAGMLHDIGKLAIPNRALRMADGLSVVHLSRIATHPARGVEMLGDIEFLKDSLDAILHHHERMDGRGYPAGLSGDDIPLFARVIAVADAFDSLTTSRAHRDAHTVEDAVAELRRRAGSQFDPSIVAALERGLARSAWEPNRLDQELVGTAGRTFYHDDPESSDLMAERADLERADLQSASSKAPRPELATSEAANPELAASAASRSAHLGPGSVSSPKSAP
jgi:hypothetical protein